jgi:NADH:ubiquinone oxidoreductase subunit 5 (subunit L)/multisubunit Na+/H+ antiporter MnhA subunit
LFLIAALAICGLPPLNGFISEFLIYSGLFNGIVANPLSSTIVLVSALFSLVIIGGMAILCFTKAFGIIFLGKERHPYPAISETGFPSLLPKYMAASLILTIGLLPQLFIRLLIPVVRLFTSGKTLIAVPAGSLLATIRTIGLSAIAFIIICAVVYIIKRKVTATKKMAVSPTWSCGYPVASSHLQYTANSFVRSFRKLVRPLLMMNKSEGVVEEVFPGSTHSETHPYDRFEAMFIDKPLRFLKRFLGKFEFLQNGSEQFYILYGVAFIIIVITIPILIDVVVYLMNLFKQV